MRTCTGCKYENVSARNEPCSICDMGSKFEQTDGKDNVNRPEHYRNGGMECIDAMQETQGVQAVKDFCICNAFKYLWRHGKKNGVEDVKKAIWYLNKYIRLEESEK